MRVGTWVAVCALCGLLGPDLDSSPVIVSVHRAEARRTLPPSFHGMNYVAFWDPAQGSPASGRALAQAGIRNVRFPGGEPADWFDWRCPYYTDKQADSCPERPVATSWSRTSALDVWRFADSIGASVTFQTNVAGGGPRSAGGAVNSPESAAAWARYAEQQGMRAVFEVGNEEDMQMKRQRDPVFDAYVETFNAQARAIHAADPKARVLGPTATNEYYWWQLDALGQFLAGAGDKNGSGEIDAVSLHYYAVGSWEQVVDTAQRWTRSGGPWAFIERTIAQHDSRPLPVFITEWNVGEATARFNASVGHALLTADIIGAFAESGVAGHQYFAIHGVDKDPHSFGVLYGEGESRPTDTPTPTYYALVLWGKMGDRVLRVSSSADSARGVSVYSTARSDGSVQVLAINKSSVAEDLSLSDLGAGSRRATIHRLGAPDGRRESRDVVYNGQLNPPPGQLPEGAGLQWTSPNEALVLPGFSMVLLDVGD